MRSCLEKENWRNGVAAAAAKQFTMQAQVTRALPDEPVHEVVVVRTLKGVTQDCNAHCCGIIVAFEAAGGIVTWPMSVATMKRREEPVIIVAYGLK